MATQGVHCISSHPGPLMGSCSHVKGRKNGVLGNIRDHGQGRAGQEAQEPQPLPPPCTGPEDGQHRPPEAMSLTEGEGSRDRVGKAESQGRRGGWDAEEDPRPREGDRKAFPQSLQKEHGPTHVSDLWPPGLSEGTLRI